MGKRWTPGSTVSNSEPVGRRLFYKKQQLMDPNDTESYRFPDLTHFEDKRSKELSLDRMGQTGIDKRVKNYLLPRADYGATKFSPPKHFCGWAVMAAKHLSTHRGQNFPVMASKIEGDELDELETNEYHAHVITRDTDEITDKELHYFTALQLHYLFEYHGSLDMVNKSKSLGLVNQRKSLWQRIIDTFNKMLS